jgi:hypothetical protein
MNKINNLKVEWKKENIDRLKEDSKTSERIMFFKK